MPNQVMSSATAGGKGGIRLNFDSSTTMADPGAGDFRVNGAGTIIAISAVGAVGALDISAILATFQLGGTIRIESNNTNDTSFVLATITAITNNTTWYQLGVTTLSSAAFSAAEECVLSYVDSAETPTYTSLDDASLPAAASNNNLVVSLGKIKANLPTAKRCLAVSDGSVYRGMYFVALVDDPTTKSIVTANNTALTWSVTAGGVGNAFVVLTSSAAHGLTGAICDKVGGLTVANLHVASASVGWEANTLIPINTVDSTTQITTDYPIGALTGTVPVISEATDECFITQFTLPPALATSRWEIHCPLILSNTANAKTFTIKLGGTTLWALTGITSNPMQFGPFCFYNKNSTAKQEARGGAASLSQAGMMAVPATAAIETSGGAAVVGVYATPSTVNEIIGIRSMYVNMVY